MKNAAKTIFDKPWKHLAAAIIGFTLAYVLVSWAIDSGRLTAYFGTIVLTVFALQHLFQAVRKYAKQN